MTNTLKAIPLPRCPYCDAEVRIGVDDVYDDEVRIECRACGALWEAWGTPISGPEA